MLRRRNRPKGTKLFFATDVHGSDVCFRKWLNAARVYGVDAIVLGGDITGKALIPIIERAGDRWESVIDGTSVTAANSDELASMRRRAKLSGFYDVLVTDHEARLLLADPDQAERRLDVEVAERLREWVALAEERLSDSGVVATIMLGNDDAAEHADILRTGERLLYSEDRIVELPGGYEMISVGLSNPTPFHTPREVPEAELAAQIDSVASRLARPDLAVFNFHCPPHGTLLDQAPRLDSNLRPVGSAGGIEMIPIGSTSVREAIERYQPLVGLHGHVHESPGVHEIGRTRCINPGSEYVDGIVRGVIVTLYPEGKVQWHLVQG